VLLVKEGTVIQGMTDRLTEIGIAMEWELMCEKLGKMESQGNHPQCIL
jgi:hypothetical protein